MSFDIQDGPGISAEQFESAVMIHAQQFFFNVLRVIAAVRSHWPRWRGFAAAAIIALVASHGPSYAQQAPSNGVLADGNAVVTGFSGAQPPRLIAPQANPADQTFIDLNGPALRVIDLQGPLAPPRTQLLQAPKPFTLTAGRIGQVFAVALDNASPPNIYAASTSAYGLPIVVANAGGEGAPVRAKQGAPNASFMPGLFGPSTLQGGPGSIWRIDGVTGETRLFANVTLGGAPNPGPALGGLAFDAASSNLFVADRGTGMIHRLDMTGAERSHYDHGAQGRPSAGLPAAPFNPANRLDIASAQFHTDDPATWGYAPPERRIFGLAVHAGRLYYAVAERLQIWSVAIMPDGTFAADARIEVTVAPGAGATEISKIAFDDQGRMLLAERAAPTGAYDFGALAQPGIGRVLRYAPTASVEAGAAWQAAPDEYAIGFFGEMKNGDGGVALGYSYDPAGKLNRASCGGFLWSTGEQLRVSADSGLAARLAQGGPVSVNGLQGNGADLVRPANAPPLASYFVDYDDRFDDPNARGGLGDIAIRRNCAPPSGPPGAPPPEPAPGPAPGPGPGPAPGPAPAPGPGPGFGGEEGGLPPWIDEGGPGPWWDDGPPPPPPICPPGSHLATNALQCCPVGQIPGFGGVCQPICPNGAAGLECWHGFQPGHGPGPGGPGICWNGAAPTKIPGCAPNTLACNKCPKSPLKKCPTGFNLITAPPGVPTAAWLWSNATCVATPAQAACSAGTTFCAAWGTCAAGGQIGLDGLCHAAMCPGGQTAYPVNKCCLNGAAPNALGQCPGIPAPPVWFLDYLATGTGPCIPPNCSYYEFTVTGREHFGRGSLTQRITLPSGSDFPEARVTRAPKYCAASRWSCSKEGDVFTCGVEDCGLAPGDEVVVRLEGKVAPNLTEPPPAPIEKTACGVLEWREMTGRSPASAIEQSGGEARKAPTPQREAQQETGGGVVTPTKQACWTIRIAGKTPTAPVCPPNYASTADGQCCLSSQITTGGACCPAGQQPDAQKSTCVGVCTGGRVWNGAACACPPGTTERRGKCVGKITPALPEPHVPPVIERQPCPPGTIGKWQPNCQPIVVRQPCPPGTIGKWQPNCRPIVVRQPCPPGTIGKWQPNCRPIVVRQPCPPGTIGKWQPNCRPIIVRQPCPPGTIGKWQPNCRPIVVRQPCPPGTIGRWQPNCRPIIRQQCPLGTVGTPPNCRPILRRPTPGLQTPGWPAQRSLTPR
ncbi:hypothetical protein [Methylocystis sp. B8]|uniref:hypothetical protein n=1 Tax=Methylocystis sp. B8 TaxID=544938 RepID=UPI0010FDC557|nr:hypothetical protein [Methylocystis sp. B8]TLG74091.1 hypothetical protein FEV16_12645 [Methylocystis sp. B8]